MTTALLGAIEAGGTKFVCAVGSGPDDIRDLTRIPTSDPDATLAQVVTFFRDGGVPDAIGIASFGPLELRRSEPAYGHFTATPKPGWSGVDLVGTIAAGTGAAIELETDVVGAALGEWRWGAGQGHRTIVYITVGTGIGGGMVVDGAPIPGLVHSEMGHVAVRRHPEDNFPGRCPFHGDCLEGMASGPAIEDRWGARGEVLDGMIDRVVEMEAHYLATGLRSIVYTVAPEKVIIGGGVASLPGLIDLVGAKLVDEMAEYSVQPEHRAGFVVLPGLGDRSGVAGAFALAELATSI